MLAFPGLAGIEKAINFIQLPKSSRKSIRIECSLRYPNFEVDKLCPSKGSADCTISMKSKQKKIQLPWFLFHLSLLVNFVFRRIKVR